MSSEIEDIRGEEPPGSVSGLPETLTVTGSEKDAVDCIPTPPDAVGLAEGVVVPVDDISLIVPGGVSCSNHEEDGTFLSKMESDDMHLSRVKRPRLTVDEKQPSVHVIYSSLPRESRKKLGELLQLWSQWHSQNCPPSDDSNAILETGEETYYPALQVGMNKPCAVTFWVDDKVKTHLSEALMPLDSASVPLYDRGYSSALGSADGSSSSEGGRQNLESFRCFNCGSYSHGLKDCPRPRDNMAVNNARKVHKSKRNQNRNSNNLTRYYQGSRKGKFDGLKPGILDAETRKALGLGELDPPPWLNRMREIGYPPGYLDQDHEDEPSGITIFGDEVVKEESEEGEIFDATTPTPTKKKMVEFPGVNAPIPAEADERLWAPASPSRNHRSGERWHSINDNSTGSHSRRHYLEPSWHDSPADYYLSRSYQEPSWHRRQYLERRWNRDLEEDLPPGCDPGMSPSLSNRYSRYTGPNSVPWFADPWRVSFLGFPRRW